MPALHTLYHASTVAVWLYGTAVTISALVSVLAKTTERRQAAHTTLKILLRRAPDTGHREGLGGRVLYTRPDAPTVLTSHQVNENSFQCPRRDLHTNYTASAPEIN
jgi:hypothetical protein